MVASRRRWRSAPAGLLLGWESTLHPFRLHPSYQRLVELEPAARLAELRKPAVRAEILADKPVQTMIEGLTAIITGGWETMYPLGDPPEYEPGPERSIASLAEKAGKAPADFAYELMLENEGKGLIYLPILGYADGDLEAIRAMMEHPAAVFSLSDGGAHCGLICDASIPTYLLTHWVRDRARGDRFALEDIVERQTRRTARFYGMEDRGTLEPGMKADLNVIDFDALRIHAPEMVYDLPAGGRRLIQQIDGYAVTVKSGEITFEHGKATGALPGTLVRGPQLAP